MGSAYFMETSMFRWLVGSVAVPWAKAKLSSHELRTMTAAWHAAHLCEFFREIGEAEAARQMALIAAAIFHHEDRTNDATEDPDQT